MITSPSYRPAAEDSEGHILDTPLDLEALINQAHHPKAGALVIFSGEVREGSGSNEVAYLEYEAHVPIATKMIAMILEEAKYLHLLHPVIH